ncbi:MAG: competence/damage-inducible protein A [Acidobacteriota bacterium]|nr:competence/damage-inducible protein A [Blastocatellia bacterium]MDW8412180.1 competence/damage-inducible protein A [Acidobacteriota bacterium]
MAIKAEIIAIGSELLTPSNIDTNSLWLTEQLNRIGIEVQIKTIVGDDEALIEQSIRKALERSQVIISTGGLGPTEDDLTRMVFAKVLGRPLILDTQILEHIRAKFEARGLSMPENNQRQALIIKDAKILANSKGTAPGMYITEAEKRIIILPGPPREMKPMFEQEVLPLLKDLSQGMCVKRRVLKVTGLTESGLDESIAPIYSKYTNPSTTILFTNRELQIHLTAKAANESEADELLDELSKKLEARLGLYVFSSQGETLEEVTGKLLKLKNLTLATAESCTGGLLAERITSVAGSSAYFLQGVVSYSNHSKLTLLGVPLELIESLGAASAEVAEAMATGIRRLANSDIGISITGIAGPESDPSGKPIGLVYIGLATASEVSHKELRLQGEREQIRWHSSTAALDWLRRKLC